MAVASTTTAHGKGDPPAPALLSCAALARFLPALIAQENAAEHQEEASAVAHRRDALQALILTTPARTLEDAAAQLLMAYDQVRYRLDLEGLDQRDEPVLGALRSALAVVGQAAGVRWQDFSIGFYTNVDERRAIAAAGAA